MKLSRIIPLVSLGTVCAVVAISALHDEPLGMEFTVPPQDTEIPDVDLGLGTQVLRALLVDEMGQPVPDAGITTVQAGRPIWTWSAGDGTFELTELRPGSLLLHVVALNFESTQFDVVVQGPQVNPDPDAEDDDANVAPIRLILDRRIGDPPEPPPLALGDLTGAVNFGPKAQPELGYELLFQPTTMPTDPSGGFPRRERVRADGTFTVDLLHAGEYRVILLSPEDRGARGPDLLQPSDGMSRTMVHETGGDTPRLELVAKMGAITGSVVSSPMPASASSDGGDQPAPPTPIRGALVRVERLGESRASAESWRGSEAWVPPGSGAPDSSEADAERDETVNKVTFRAVRSGESGEFSLRDLPPGRYRLTLVAGRKRHNQDVTVPERQVVTVNVDLSGR